MKKAAISIAALMAVATSPALGASEAGAGDAKASVSVPAPTLRVWRAAGPLGYTRPSSLDTLLTGYQVEDPGLNRTIALQSLGNQGSPAQSKIFSDNISRSDFLFLSPFNIYHLGSEDMLYFNTPRPYANVSYSSGGPTNRKQEHIGLVFSVNATPHLNFGLLGRWQNNYGCYDNQATRNYKAGVFGSYIHRHHSLMANVLFSGYHVRENGGLYDTKYITDPKNTGELDAYSIPTNFDDKVNNKIAGWNSYLNYKYNFGYDKSVPVTADSSTSEFVPVSSIIYTFKSESYYRRYLEDFIGSTSGMTTDSLYKQLGIGLSHSTNNYYTQDSLHFWQMTHVAGLSLNEEFNTLGHFGLAGYFTYNHKEYGQRVGLRPYSDFSEDYFADNHISLDEFGSDSAGFIGQEEWRTTTRERFGIGASVSKHSGSFLTFDLGGEYYFKDEKSSGKSYRLDGNAQSNFSLGRNSFLLSLEAHHSNLCPDYFTEEFFGNRMQWHNDFVNETRTDIDGRVGATRIVFFSDSAHSWFARHIAPDMGLVLRVGQTSLNDFVYFGTDARPHQHGDAISITRVSLQEKLKLWYLHLDNELTYQYCNAPASVLSLPKLSLYSNWYFQTNPLFKVLTLQIGADLHYNTAYYAAAYLPANGMYYAQDDIKLGDYPYMDAYLSFHLKTFRFFLIYSHLNNLWQTTHNYLVTPDYALDPEYIRMGISVNFDN